MLEDLDEESHLQIIKVKIHKNTGIESGSTNLKIDNR